MCETWFLTLLNAFEEEALRILGPMTEELIEGCRKLHTEGLHS